MTASDLQDYLHRHIPLSAAMQVAVLDVSPQQVLLGAPLAPNINHRGTGFGGSASAISMLTAWSLLHTRLKGLGIDCHLVIQGNTMQFERPITDAFTARATLTQPQAWEPFVQLLQRRGRARTGVSVELQCAGVVAARLDGEFVALQPAGG